MSVVIRVLALLALSGLATVFPISSFAEDETSEPYGDVRIARISLIEGEVLLQRADDEEWVAATVNMPLRPHDKLWATDGARGEIQFDDGSAVRLAENTSLDLLELEPDWIHLQLTLGVASFAARAPFRMGAQHPFLELDTPQTTAQASRTADFRADVAEDGSTVVTVRKGEVELIRDEGPVVIAADQRAAIEGGDAPDYLVESAADPDAWDRWVRDRNADLARTENREHLPSDTEMGVTELNTYGTWNQIQPYGWVWAPRVAVGWAPYHFGRWVWVEPWGWTWVSYEPWGWLPYHYGRWVVAGSIGWVWIPAPAPWIWTPGCVRFIYGPTWVSWVPLGPGEVYYFNKKPPEHRHFDSHLSNYHAPGGMNVMSRHRFVTGRPEDKGFVPPKDPMRAGRVAVGPPPVVPTRASLRPAPQKVIRADLLPPQTINRPVVYTRKPSPPPPLFEHRVKEIHGVITQGRPPTAAPPVPEKKRPRITERRTTGEKIQKGYIIRGANPPTRPMIAPKPQPHPRGRTGAPSQGTRTHQPAPPKSIKLPRTQTEPAPPRAAGGRSQQARPLYKVPPTFGPNAGSIPNR